VRYHGGVKFAKTLALCAVFIGMLAACGGGGTTVGQGHPCPQIVATDFLVYPAPGSTGIPDATHVVVVIGPVDQITLRPMVGPPIVTTSQVSVPSPIPSPNAENGSSPEKAFSVPTLSASTTYTVISELTTRDPICPFGAPQTIGSFTTQ
jgi:hypothetical protein